MYKLTITLKQHTPIIHFQHDQAGATLRASEVKPKLDKFIIEQMGGIDKIPKEWHISDNNEALDYKMKINCTLVDNKYFLPLASMPNNTKKTILETFIRTKIKEIEILAPAPYFANEDKLDWNKRDSNYNSTKFEDLKIAVKSNKDLNGVITSFNEDLLKKINEHISLFFLLNNFGTRQNKGFGSFTVLTINKVAIKIDDISYKENFLLKSNVKSNNIFKFISEEYQLIKSGKNHNVYEKSELFKYYINIDIRWEKRHFKKFINIATNRINNKELFYKRINAPIDVEKNTQIDYNAWNDKQNNDYKYIRALLGLAEQFEFTVFAEREGNKLINNNNENYADYNKKYLVSIEHKPKTGMEKIERFKSPIFIKVIDGFIYLAINDTYNKILNEEFKFDLKLKGDSNIPTVNKTISPLFTPSFFDIKSFINNCNLNNWKKLNP